MEPSEIRKDRPTRVDPWEGKKKLLAVADVQTGYHHDSISHALSTVERLGRESGNFITNIRTDSQLITRAPIVGVGSKYGGKPVNARNLQQYSALFLLPSGEGTLSAQQKDDLLSYVHDDGGGLIVGHAAMLGFYDWPEFAEMIGAGFGGEFMSKSTVVVEDPTFPGADSFGETEFEFQEQHPIVKEPYCREDLNIIFSIKAETIDQRYRSKRNDDDFPVVWSRTYGKGRVFQMGWGHMEATWDDQRFQRFMLAAIQWTMGD